MFFFQKSKLFIVWNWFVEKIISILEKYLFWIYLKWGESTTGFQA